MVEELLAMTVGIMAGCFPSYAVVIFFPRRPRWVTVSMPFVSGILTFVINMWLSRRMG